MRGFSASSRTTVRARKSWTPPPLLYQKTSSASEKNLPRGEGSNLTFYEARDARAEAEYVCQRVSEIQREDSAAHCAVMYRTNAQSRALEEVFRARGIPYTLVGGFTFFPRA